MLIGTRGKTMIALACASATLLASCNDKVELPGKYYVRLADNGKAWVHRPDDTVLVGNVTRVAEIGGNLIVETRKLREEPPYGNGDCEYFRVRADARQEAAPRKVRLLDADKVLEKSVYYSDNSCLGFR
jgi:hypothetical protein